MTILDAFLQVITTIGGFLFSPLIVAIVLVVLCVFGIGTLVGPLWETPIEWILFWVIWPSVVLFTISFIYWLGATGTGPLSWSVS